MVPGDMVAIPFQRPYKIPTDIPLGESLLLMATLILLALHWQVQDILKDGPFPTFFGFWWKWAKMFFNDLILFSLKSWFLFSVCMVLFSVFFRELRQDCSLGVFWCLGLLGSFVWVFGVFFFQLVAALNYPAQLLLATILGARSSAWLILIQLVCWQTEFYAILNALSGLWTSFKDLCCSGIGEELGEMSCKTRSQNILKAHIYAVF